MRLSSLVRVVLPSLLLLAVDVPSGHAQSRCNTLSSTNCSTNTCYVHCTSGTAAAKESELRQAVDAANKCKGKAGYTGRTITFNGPCTIDLQNSSSSGATYANCGTAESDADFKYSICLVGDDVTVDGGDNVTFNYAGSAVCNPNCDSCGPAPFVMRGNRNTVRRFRYQFFPEGILIRTGDRNKVDHVRSDFYCDEAVTVGGSGTPTNSVVTGSRFTGHTCSSRCSVGDAKSPCGANQPTCGSDKVIQLLTGTNTGVGLNTFVLPGQAVRMNAGTADISGNNAYGHATKDISQSFTVSGGTAEMKQNVLVRHKFGIRVEGTGKVNAEYNGVFTCYNTGFQVRGSGALRGYGNRIKDCGTDGCSPGGLAATNSASSKVDFGGGDCNGATVIPGKATSFGQNVFCQGFRTDINARTYPMAPQDCSGASSNACMRAHSNCFENGPTVVGGPVSTTGATTSCVCNFEPPAPPND